jgi:hypothetical protein
MPLTRDADLTIRRTAIEVFAELASSGKHVDALWICLDPAQEPDEPTRRLAWRGILRILTTRPLAELEERLARLPQDGAERSGRALDLLQLMERSLAAAPQSRAELGQVRARIAAERAALSQFDESIAAFLAALADLHAAQSPRVQEVGLQLLRVALLNGRYTEAVAAALANGNPPLDGAELWQALAPHLVALLTPEKAEQLIGMLQALRAQPPAVFSSSVLDAIDEMLQRARALHSQSASSAPATQPDSPQ